MIRVRALAPILAALLFAAAPARAGEQDDATYAKALDWMLGKQLATGGWGQMRGAEDGELGMTGLVVKALAEAPEPFRAKARAAADKGAGYLLTHQQDDGSFTQGRSGLATYRTSIAISALTALDRTKYQAQVQKAVAWLKGEQLDEAEQVGPDKAVYGGFGYGAGGRGAGGADLSNTHLALAALRDAGVPQDDPVFQRALKFLARCQNDSEVNDAPAGWTPSDDGGFVYTPTGSTGEHSSYGGMTYAGLLSLIYAGLKEDDKRVVSVRRWIAKNYSVEENRGLGEGRELEGLFYYLHTFAKCLAATGQPTVQAADGEHRWAQDLFDQLRGRQAPDGSFSNPADKRWWEKEPILATAYALNAMNAARPFLPAK